MRNDNASSVSSKADGIDYLSAMLAGHRLALSIKDVWTSCVKAQVDPLTEMQDRIGATSFDNDTSFDDLIANLREFFKDCIATAQDETFSHDFVQQSHTQIVTIVANFLPNDVAANYDLDVLRRSLREVVGDFANRARKLPTWEHRAFTKQVASLKEELGVRRHDVGLVPKSMFTNIVLSKKKHKRKAVQFARDQVGLLIDNIQELAKDTESKLVGAVLSPSADAL